VCLGFAAVLLVHVSGCGGPRVPVPRTSDRYEYEAGKASYDVGHYIDAQTHLKRFLDVHPGHAAADSAQMLLGMAQFEVKSYAEAAVEFAILVREFPRSALLDAASYQECLCYKEQMRDAELDPTFAFRTRACLNEFILRYPESPKRDEARQSLQEIADLLAEKEFRLGMMWTKMKRYRAAIIYFDEVLDKYPTSSWVPDSLFWKARCLEERKQFDEAIDMLRLLINSFPEHKVTPEGRRELEHLEHQARAERSP
jgi:outer membrane protein assembly factor BamD